MVKAKFLWLFAGLLLALTTVSSGSAATAPDVQRDMPWLVRVRSTYADQADATRPATFEGRGFVVERDGTQWIVTAAHLTEGNDLVVEWFDAARGSYVPVAVRTTFVSNPNDVAFLSLRPDQARLPALARWVAASATDGDAPEGHAAFRVIPEALGDMPASGPWADPRWLRTGLLTSTPVLARDDRAKDGFEGTDASTLQRIARETPWSFIARSVMGVQAGATEFSVDVTARPGMSGSPVLLRSRPGRYALFGIVSATSRVFRQSSVATAEIATRFLDEIVLPRTAAWTAAGSEPPAHYSDDKVQWFVRNGLLYRVGYVPGTATRYQEVAWRQEPTGDGHRADTGDGDSSALQASYDPVETFARYGLEPGFTLSGGGVSTAVRAFEIRDGSPHFFAADTASLAYLNMAAFFAREGQGPRVALRFYGAQDDFSESLRDHLGRIMGPGTTHWSLPVTSVQIAPIVGIGAETFGRIDVQWPAACPGEGGAPACFAYELRLGDEHVRLWVDGLGAVYSAAGRVYDRIYPTVTVTPDGGGEAVEIDLHSFVFQNPQTFDARQRDRFESRCKRAGREYILAPTAARRNET